MKDITNNYTKKELYHVEEQTSLVPFTLRERFVKLLNYKLAPIQSMHIINVSLQKRN